MSPKDILILHGEKALVVLIGGACVWSMIGAMTNAEIRPAGGAKGMSAEEIKQAIASIDGYIAKANPPQFKPVPNYAGRLAGDLARPVVADPAMAWLTAHPDLGTVVSNDFFYVYESLPFTVKAEDKIGAVSLSLVEPTLVRGLDRLKSGDDASWERKAATVIQNWAQIVGVQVERQDGETWKPVGTGFIPYADLGTAIPIDGVEDFATYRFRARPVIAATGVTFGKDGGGSVFIHLGQTIPVDGDDQAAEAFVAKCANALLKGEDADLLSRLARPVGQVPPGVTLEPRENIYHGPWSEVASVQVSSPIRFQLDKLSPNVDEESATILLTRLVRDGSREGWLDMQKFTLAKGDMLGAKGVRAKDPLRDDGRQVEFDLSTPFKLVKVERGVSRTLYYEIKPKSRTDGSKGKDLELNVKTTSTDTATLLNTRTNEQIVLVKLGRITTPVGDRILDPPDLKNGDEEAWFKEGPAAFKQTPLLPPPPIKHAPGTGPLEDLLKSGMSLAKTDTDYFELSNGQLVFWEPINSEVRKVYKLGVEPPPEPVATVPEVTPDAPPTTGGRRTSRQPGAEAPMDGESMIPPDFMPPPEEMLEDGSMLPPPEPAPTRRRGR